MEIRKEKDKRMDRLERDRIEGEERQKREKEII
jgi:hypothetical protein